VGGSARVFHNYALHPHMSVAENLSFALMRKMPERQIADRVDTTAHVLGLDELLDRKPKALSGGQRQRVAMGGAIVREPRVFLMMSHCPTWTPSFAWRCELTRLHQRYHTTVYVTHDQVEAMTLGDRIAVLDKGRLQQVGTPDELYFQPANIFVAGFMGSPSMNLMRVRLVAGDPFQLVVGERRWPLPAGLLADRPALAGYVNREVILGLRPDAVAWPADPGGVSVEISPMAVESPVSVVLSGQLRPPATGRGERRARLPRNAASPNANSTAASQIGVPPNPSTTGGGMSAGAAWSIGA
jgi:multiple sugar transport system ATP-binding protein